MKSKENFQKSVICTKMQGFGEFSLFFQGKHLEFRKVPHFCQPARELAVLWFALLGRLCRNSLVHREVCCGFGSLHGHFVADFALQRVGGATFGERGFARN